MPYTFKITFPDVQKVTLCAQTRTEADSMERALIELSADFVIVGPKWIAGCLGMTSLGGVLCKCQLDGVGGSVRVDREPLAYTNGI